MEASVSPDQAPGGAVEGREFVPWTWLDGAVVLISAFVIYVIGSIILALIDYPIDHRHPGFWLIPASYFSLTLGTFLMIQFWIIIRRQASWADVGFRLPRGRSPARTISRIIGIAIAAYIVTIIGVDIIVFLLSHTSFHVKSNVKELLPAGQSTVTVGQYVTLIILAGVVAPFTEETLFRGALYQGVSGSLGRSVGKPAGIVISAVVVGLTFGLFHLIGGGGELYTLPVLGFLGIVLCFVFQLSDSLAGSMLLHGMVNLISVVGYYGTHLR